MKSAMSERCNTHTLYNSLGGVIPKTTNNI